MTTAIACLARVRSPLLLKTTSPRPVGFDVQPVVPPPQYSQPARVTQRDFRQWELREFASVVPCVSTPGVAPEATRNE